MYEGFRSLMPSGLIVAVMAAGFHNPLAVSLCLAALAGTFTFKAIPLVRHVFISHGRFGEDKLKKDKPITPESLGAVAGVLYFFAMFLFIPVPFIRWFRESDYSLGEEMSFPHDKFAQFLGGLLSLLSMLFLGFADDVLDIRWRVKIWFPLIASMPLLMVYAITYGGTDIVLPIVLRPLFGTKLLHLGGLYYCYMAALAIFSTNAINILAGVNGVEAGQALIIGLSIVFNDLLQLHNNPSRADAHLTSLYFLLPFIGVTLGFLKHNWYPAKAFPGDTYCYFAGMVFAVVGILGNFSKTVLLFMVPQIFNFVYSCPQLFHFVECPRHRMPSLNVNTGLLEASRFKVDKVGRLGWAMLRILEILHLIEIRRDEQGKPVDANNLTLMSLLLVKFGPMREDSLALSVMAMQALCSCLAFVVRYQLVHLVYNEAEDDRH
ncbi:UDP-N-acetylglucosamine--dolichyl-phosphate N-acetylglucosaminephosphotransferase [Gaertneriomyces semiglobifer]|nr:UDP-N-acetylglucosamine--dolichyl-phosphate N-acetylglucosaminephosphotransferase [Gaertneriomyces semiglobifer]